MAGLLLGLVAVFLSASLIILLPQAVNLGTAICIGLGVGAGVWMCGNIFGVL